MEGERASGVRERERERNTSAESDHSSGDFKRFFRKKKRHLQRNGQTQASAPPTQKINNNNFWTPKRPTATEANPTRV